jgi:hypothetical protein
MVELDKDLSISIVQAIAQERGVEPTELGYTLQDHIETDALRLLARSDTETWTLSFDVPDGRVTVTGTGRIEFDTFGDTELASKAEVTTDLSTVD